MSTTKTAPACEVCGQDITSDSAYFKLGKYGDAIGMFVAHEPCLDDIAAPTDEEAHHVQLLLQAKLRTRPLPVREQLTRWLVNCGILPDQVK